MHLAMLAEGSTETTQSKTIAASDSPTDCSKLFQARISGSTIGTELELPLILPSEY